MSDNTKQELLWRLEGNLDWFIGQLATDRLDTATVRKQLAGIWEQAVDDALHRFRNAELEKGRIIL